MLSWHSDEEDDDSFVYEEGRNSSGDPLDEVNSVSTSCDGLQLEIRPSVWHFRMTLLNHLLSLPSQPLACVTHSNELQTGRWVRAGFPVRYLGPCRDVVRAGAHGNGRSS